MTWLAPEHLETIAELAEAANVDRGEMLARIVAVVTEQGPAPIRRKLGKLALPKRGWRRKATRAA